MSMESIRIWPSWTLRRRRRTDVRVDFPDPVRPQIQILWPAGALKVMFLSTGVQTSLDCYVSSIHSYGSSGTNL